MKFQFTQEIQMSAEQFWLLFFHNEQFADELYTQLKFSTESAEEKKMDPETGNIERIRLLKLVADLPSFVATYIREVTFKAQVVYEKQSSVAIVRIVPNAMTERFQFTMKIKLLEKSSQKSQMNVEGELSVNVPLIGSRIEKFFEGELNKALFNALQVIAKWAQKTQA